MMMRLLAAANSSAAQWHDSSVSLLLSSFLRGGDGGGGGRAGRKDCRNGALPASSVAFYLLRVCGRTGSRHTRCCSISQQLKRAEMAAAACSASHFVRVSARANRSEQPPAPGHARSVIRAHTGVSRRLGFATRAFVARRSAHSTVARSLVVPVRAIGGVGSFAAPKRCAEESARIAVFLVRVQTCSLFRYPTASTEKGARDAFIR